MIKQVCYLALAVVLFSCNHRQQAATKTNDIAYLQDVPPARFCGPSSAVLNTPPGFDGTLVPLFAGLTENFTYPITTKSKVAQKYFDQGLILAYGFNHAEAARSFKEATRQDPDCASCYWGLAYVLGPNYNSTMKKDVLAEAQEALANARLRADKCSPKENALIIALSKRYPQNTTDDPKPFYIAYADDLKKVSEKYPDDHDIAALYAESLMNLHPWNLWLKTGEPQPWTPQIIDILEGILRKNPRHAQAVHLYIHATEASSNPERCLPYANTLRALIPGSGHLVHMPSHTYINTGHYHEGVLANERAVQIDSQYIKACQVAGVYPFGYYPHNWHFLTACAALEGRSKKALEASQFLAQYIADKGIMGQPDRLFSQTLYSTPWFIMVKFGKWDKILTEPKPNDTLLYPLSAWTYAQGMASAAKGNVQHAQKCLSILKELEFDTTIAKIDLTDSSKATTIVAISRLVLEGEIAYRKGNLQSAIILLRKGVETEDNLYYDEPPDWLLSVRHNLGRVLIEAGQYVEAEKVYRADLKKYKENGWALIGLYQALLKQGKKTEARLVRMRYEKAWQYADIPLTNSVL
ncbi:MAG: tetratricopeptide repeat protein [Saprospiraceae bacterium]|nr:tetratricopeptide repeat protein [Saprospiraceae bacterium]